MRATETQATFFSVLLWPLFLLTFLLSSMRNPSSLGDEGAGTSSAPRSEYQIAGEDLAPVKARILLMLAPTKTQDPTDIQRMFTEY